MWAFFEYRIVNVSLISTAVVLFMAAFVGWAIWRIAFTGKSLLEDNPTSLDPEKQVIRLAMKMKGKVTIPDVCANTPLGLTEAKATLENLTREGVFHLEMTDTGAKVYALDDMASIDEKAGSKKLI